MSCPGSSSSPKNNPASLEKEPLYYQVLNETLEEAEWVGYQGYSKFDGLLSPITQALSFGWWPLRLFWSQFVTRFPFNLRPLLGIKKGINPEALALFAHANLDCAALGVPGHYSFRAETCLEWSLAHKVSANHGYHGKCWGYNHPWQSRGFYQPANSPNCYLTVIVASAFVHGYQVIGKEQYLEVARSAVDFLMNDLPVFFEDNQQKSIGYIPNLGPQMQVININALAGALIAQVGVTTGEGPLVEQARRLMNFVARQQTPYGGWFYTTNPQKDLLTHDNYHTGMILDALWTYAQTSGDTSFETHRRHGLEYYRQHLFTPYGAPKWSNQHTWPHDIHGSGQGILTFALTGDLDTARQIASWAIDHFYKGAGDFAYQQGRFLRKPFTLLHWGNGWMARGLAALLLAQQKSYPPTPGS
ncbi:MAG: hypothetical protein AB1345_09560 [Chloroflexota bacterium]